MTQVIPCADGRNRDQAVKVASTTIKRGGLVIVPTENAYLVVADAFRASATALVRSERGMDPQTPLTVLVPRPATVQGITSRIPDSARALMAGLWPGPLTLLLTPASTLAWDHPAGAPLSVRMPVHPVALAVLAASGPVAAALAAPVGSPAPRTAQEAMASLANVGVVLDAGELPEEMPGSTIVDCTREPAHVVRQGVVGADELQRVWPEVQLAP